MAQPAADSLSGAEASAAIELLQAQLEMTRQFQGDMLETVYWSLGVVVVLVGLLLGFGWFVNLRVYERDKESLRQELMGKLDQETASVKSEISELSSALTANVSELSTSVNSRLGEEISALSKSLKKEVSGHVSSQIESVNQRLLSIEFEAMAEELDARIKSGSHNMALTSALHILTRAFALDRSSTVESMLKGILDSLKAGGKFTVSEVARITTILDKLPASHAILGDKVRQAVAESDLHP